MNELSRSLLAAARQGLAPDAAVAARVRAKVAAAVGASAVGAAGTAAAVKTTAIATFLKIGAVLIAVGVVATVVVVTRPERSPEAPRVSVMPRDNDDVRADIRVAAPAESLPSSSEQPTPPTHRAKHATPLVEEAPGDPQATVPSTVSPSAAPSVASLAGRSPQGSSSSFPAGASLAREVELIDLAMVSLRKRAPHAALEAIKAYERETHGRGQMAEDAAAIAIEARCNMDLDATAAIERFDAKWPESAQRERIQTACFAKP